jgi:hypothetical protein
MYDNAEILRTCTRCCQTIPVVGWGAKPNGDLYQYCNELVLIVGLCGTRNHKKVKTHVNLVEKRNMQLLNKTEIDV